MRKIKAAILDDGVNIKYANNVKLSGNFELVDNCVVEYDSNNNYESSHGTECAGIFCSYARNYELISIKILDEKRTGCKHDLIDALKWCRDRGIELINLSIGSSCYQDYNEIKSTIEELQANGIIIVAACCNRNIRTYPASLPEVIGVRADLTGALAENEFVFIDKPHDGINIVAYNRSIYYLPNGEKRLIPANSYAAPFITALVCNYMSEMEYYDLDTISQFLKAGSVNREFMDFEYIRENMLRWKNKVDVPIIVLLYHGEDKETSKNMVRQLTSCFRDDEYCCVAYTDDCDAVNVPYVFSMEEYSAIDSLDFCQRLLLMYNTELPDVLLISMEQNKVELLEKVYRLYDIDIMICINDKDMFEKLNMEVSLCDNTILALSEKLDPGSRFFDRTINILDNIMELYLYIKNIFS